MSSVVERRSALPAAIEPEPGEAAPSFERWFGVKPEVDDALREAVLG